jgi:hypothetical protein
MTSVTTRLKFALCLGFVAIVWAGMSQRAVAQQAATSSANYQRRGGTLSGAD